MFYDTHCHPYLASKKSQELILENFFGNKGFYLNSIACDLKSSEISIETAKAYQWAHAVIWIHPTHCLDYKDTLDSAINSLRNLYEKSKEYIVAIWETWLDYYWLEKLSEKHNISQEDITTIQKQFFRAQIDVASELWLPLVIHNRASSSDIYDILYEKDFKNFVFHCFSEDIMFAQKLLNFAPECMLGFWGISTFKNTQSIQDVIKQIPLKNIMIETDSPYLTPTPLRWKEENEPLFCKYVLSKIIDLRDESSQEITQKIFENSKKFFGL